jgi:hypothetical protein
MGHKASFLANGRAVGKKSNAANRPSLRRHRPQGVMRDIPNPTEGDAMFALPFANTLHHALTNHAFGRGDPQPASPAPAPVPAAAALVTDRASDETPDLAQRVRDVGEW